MAWWERELQRLFDAYMRDNKEIEFSDYIEQYASSEFLAMSKAEHDRLEALRARGIWE